MAYFPFYIDIKGRKCMIIGGGRVALRKAEKLLGFHCDITVVAPEICPELEELPVRKLHRAFQDSDLEGAFMAIAATEDSALNTHIAELCRVRNIHINSVDDIENCSFIFPALVHERDITVGISTGGTSPVFAKHLRMLIEDELNDHYLAIAELLKNYRPIVMCRFDSEKKRKEAMEALLDLCLLDDDLPDSEDIEKLLEAIDR